MTVVDTLPLALAAGMLAAVNPCGFALLPAYLSWYFLLPRQAGGRLFSEPLARLAFLLFIPLSLPVGFHHQFLDPGVSQGYKAIHTVLTFAIFIPSMMTAFTVLASLELGGRARGGQGLLGWVTKLPWKDPVFTGIEWEPRRQTLVAQRSLRDGKPVYTFDIRVQVEAETVFFDV